MGRKFFSSSCSKKILVQIVSIAILFSVYLDPSELLASPQIINAPIDFGSLAASALSNPEYEASYPGKQQYIE